MYVYISGAFLMPSALMYYILHVVSSPQAGKLTNACLRCLESKLHFQMDTVTFSVLRRSISVLPDS